MPRERKRKICSCCDGPAPKMTSQPDVKKRRHVQIQIKDRSNPQPVLEPVNRSVVPVNHPKSVIMSKVLSCSVVNMNQDIVYKSAGRSTRRIKLRERRTVRGFGASHTFIKEVTYTFASTKIGYVGQELLPFHARPDWFNRTPSAHDMPSTSDADDKSANPDTRSGASDTPLDSSNNECDDSLNQAFYRSEDRDSSSSDSDSESDQETRTSYRHMTSGRDTRDANNLDGFTSDSSDSDSDDEPKDCEKESGKRCEKHNRWHWCYCSSWSDCPSEKRPVPETCPREMKELVEAFLTGSSDKQEYALIKEVKYDDLGCSPCIYLYNNEQMKICNRQLRNLRVDRTFNLGACYVTAFVYRNSNLILKNRTEGTYGPLMTGPVMLHFDKAFDTYVRFFQTVREKAGITTKPMSDRDVNNMQNVLSKDKLITKPMRKVFGDSMKLTSIHHVPVSLRNDLRRKVSCNAPVSSAVKAVFDAIHYERYKTKAALVGNSEWRLHPRIKEYMRKWEFSSLAKKLYVFDRLVAV